MKYILLLLLSFSIFAGDTSYKNLSTNMELETHELKGESYIRIVNNSEYILYCRIYTVLKNRKKLLFIPIRKEKIKTFYKFEVLPHKNGPWYKKPDAKIKWSCK